MLSQPAVPWDSERWAISCETEAQSEVHLDPFRHFCQCKKSSENLDAISIRGMGGWGTGPCLQTPFPHPWQWPMDPPVLSQELEIPSERKKSEQYAIAPNNSGISRIQVLSLSSNLSTMENYC